MGVLKIICDELDLFLIREMYKGALKKKEITTWDLAKMYHWGDEYKINQIGHIHYYDGKCPKVNYRMNRMARAGLLHIKKGKTENKYELEGEKVILCKVKNVKDVIDKDSEVIMVKSSDDWIMYEISS